jgi:hypothetical protein
MDKKTDALVAEANELRMARMLISDCVKFLIGCSTQLNISVTRNSDDGALGVLTNRIKNRLRQEKQSSRHARI